MTPLYLPEIQKCTLMSSTSWDPEPWYPGRVGESTQECLGLYVLLGRTKLVSLLENKNMKCFLLTWVCAWRVVSATWEEIRYASLDKVSAFFTWDKSHQGGGMGVSRWCDNWCIGSHQSGRMCEGESETVIPLSEKMVLVYLCCLSIPQLWPFHRPGPQFPQMQNKSIKFSEC